MFKWLAGFGVSTCLLVPALAQQAPAPEDSFASENAVLDTSILFAIGAREARQELRGAFGWPTFQEGLVEGVYFRFDPDGYARFASTPRLDTDVFEVICRPRTNTCMGRKDALQVSLNSRGEVLLQIENVTDADSFAISEGISELPLPNAILQPLEPRLEILLGSGGELISRRGDTEVHRISMSGFGAVVPYLRWVAARQDYTVLPRGWPVPNAGVDRPETGLTQTPGWQSPTPQPHVVTQTFTAPAQTAQAPAPAAAPTPAAVTTPQVETDVAEVRGELKVLRELLLDQQNTPAPQHVASPANSHDPEAHARIEELQRMAMSLQAKIDQLQNNTPAVTQPGTAHALATPVAPVPTQTAPMVKAPGIAPQMTHGVPTAAPHAALPKTEAQRVAQHLEYLMTELGLTPDVALMVVQQRQQATPASIQPTPQETVINDILNELRTQIPRLDQPAPPAMASQTLFPTTASNFARPVPPLSHNVAPTLPLSNDYQLLSDYFQSVSQRPQMVHKQ